MNIKNHLRLVCILSMSLGAMALTAKEPADYQIGDMVSEDVVTPVALDVIDPAATAALKSSEAAKVPSVFRNYPVATNVVVAEFNAAFEKARSNFISSIEDTFHQTTLDQATVASEDFGYLITAFNIKNKDFPVTTTLATDWAYGKPGNFEKKMLLGALLQTMQHHIRPDELPDGFGMGEMVRLSPAGAKTGRLTGPTVAKSDLATVSEARMIFRQAFTGYDEEPLTRELSAWLKPNCIPDAGLTQQAREQATSQLVVAEHYAAGQVVAPQGSVVDAKLKSAFDELQDRAVVVAGSDNPPVAATDPENKVSASVAAATVATVDTVQPVAVPAPVQPVSASQRFFKSLPYSRGVIELGAISILSALICISVGVWKLISRRRAKKPALSKDVQVQVPMAMQTALAPQLVQVVREALALELAGQRRELLVVQQNAAVEVSRMVRKMDEMQMQLRERLQMYEMQIKRLEADLAARTEENQELIKMKIEMIRSQRESETVGEHREAEMAFS